MSQVDARLFIFVVNDFFVLATIFVPLCPDV